MYRTIPQNLFMKHLTIPWLVYTMHALFLKLIAYTQFFFFFFFFNFLHLFILHLHCTTIFDDDDAICEIK